MTGKKGFSLLEMTIVILVMGMTITALLQMFDWSHIRYREIAKGWEERAFLAEIRLWLRDRVMHSQVETINIKAVSAAIKAPAHLKLSAVNLTEHDPDTFFVQVGYFDDKNRNGKADSLESASRLFCFRRRST